MWACHTARLGRAEAQQGSGGIEAQHGEAQRQSDCPRDGVSNFFSLLLPRCRFFFGDPSCPCPLCAFFGLSPLSHLTKAIPPQSSSSHCSLFTLIRRLWLGPKHNTSLSAPHRHLPVHHLPAPTGVTFLKKTVHRRGLALLAAPRNVFWWKWFLVLRPGRGSGSARANWRKGRLGPAFCGDWKQRYCKGPGSVLDG